MDEAFALELIDESEYGLLSLSNGYEAYGIPLSFVRRDRCLYFHTAREGRKLTFMEERRPVSVAFVRDAKVPQLYTQEEINILKEDPAGGAKILSSIFTTEFSSAIVNGTLFEIVNEEEKAEILRLICLKYTDQPEDVIALGIKAGMAATRVFGIRMMDVTGKRKKYDKNGREMKFGRRES